MKTKILLPLFLLTACTADLSAPPPVVTAEAEPVTLTNQVQKLVEKTQEDAISALPAEVSDYKTVEAVADREKNQKGAGFTRVYGDGEDVVITVFIYNNQDFGMIDEITPATEALMDKHLQEIQDMQASGLYDNVKAGTKSTRELRWGGQKYQVLEAPVTFDQRREPRKSFLVIGTNKDLMSYVRIRFTYPKEKQKEVERQKNVFTAKILNALSNFVKDRKTQ